MPQVVLSRGYALDLIDRDELIRLVCNRTRLFGTFSCSSVVVLWCFTVPVCLDPVRGGDKQDFGIALLFGGPGVGKSKLLQDLPSKIPQVARDAGLSEETATMFENRIELRVTFANGTPFDDTLERKRDINGKHLLAARILWGAFGALRASMPFDRFLELDLKSLTLDKVLSPIIRCFKAERSQRDELPVFISIVIDEAQILLESADAWCGQFSIVSVTPGCHLCCCWALFKLQLAT